MTQPIISGRGSLRRTGELLDTLHMTKPLIVGSPRMLRGLHDAGLPVDTPVFHDYHANPDFSDCLAGAELYRHYGCDGLLSIGGGSAIDTAKGIKALLICPTADDALHSRLPEDVALPHLAIPTSAGTGAEATPFAVLYADGQKLSLSGSCMRPDAAMLDGDLLTTLPIKHRKACALDALCQGVESWWAKDANAGSRVLALAAIRGVLSNLRAYLSGDADAAQAMLEAAWHSGQAISLTRTTAAHAMSYQLTKLLGYPHGQACMLTLPLHTRLLLQDPAIRPVLNELAQALCLPPDDLPDLFEGLLIWLDMLPNAAPDEAMLIQLTASVNPQRLHNHPIVLTADQLHMIYTEAFAPLSPAVRERCLQRWLSYDA